MNSRLLNVRLDEDRLRKVRRLRETGVMLAAAVARVLEQHPDPPDQPQRTYDVHDAGAARAAIARTLKRQAR